MEEQIQFDLSKKAISEIAVANIRASANCGGLRCVCGRSSPPVHTQVPIFFSFHFATRQWKVG